MPKHEVIENSLKKIFEGIKQLKKALPSKEFTIDGRLVGDIGEALVQRDYDVKLYDGLVKDYDGETSTGQKVQIKATFKDNLTFKKVPDYYLGIKIDENGSYEEIFNGPGELIAEKYDHRSGFGKQLLAFPVSSLKELSSKVSSKQKIPRRVIKNEEVDSTNETASGYKSEFTLWKSGSTKTTKIGFINRNNQRNNGTRGVTGTDYGQVAYKMSCLNHGCNHVYGANGTDVFQRKCPNCQGGNPGINF